MTLWFVYSYKLDFVIDARMIFTTFVTFDEGSIAVSQGFCCNSSGIIDLPQSFKLMTTLINTVCLSLYTIQI